MLAIKSLAAATGATVSGFSDGYIKQATPTAILSRMTNRPTGQDLTLLDIDTTKEFFEEALQSADTLVVSTTICFFRIPIQIWQKDSTELQTIAISNPRITLQSTGRHCHSHCLLQRICRQRDQQGRNSPVLWSGRQKENVPAST